MQTNFEPSLRDLIEKDLNILFVGINPSLYSVAQGHYFARKTNRFWPAFSRSILSKTAREKLQLAELLPCHDALLVPHGFGFTDVVKRATARADEISKAEFAAAVADLVAKIETYQPRIACFHGIMAYRPLHYALGPGKAKEKSKPQLGLQSDTIGCTRLYLVPNPSPANAHFTQDDQTAWYDRLAALLA